MPYSEEQIEQFFQEYMDNLRVAILPEDVRLPIGTKLQHEELTIEAEAVRRSFAAFQIAVEPPCATLLLLGHRTGLSRHATLGIVRHGRDILRADAEIDGLNAKLHLLGYVPGDDDCYWPDPIETGDQVEINGFRIVMLRLHVDIPSDTVPGRYEGRVVFYHRWAFEEERIVREARFTIHVHETVLPDIQQSHFRLNLWQHVSNISRQFEAPLYSEKHFELLEKCAESLGKLGNRYCTAVVSDVPWAGQGYYKDYGPRMDLYEYSLVRVFRETNGNWSYDFSIVRRWWDIMRRHGADTLMLAGLFGVWVDENNEFSNFTEDWPEPIRIPYMDRTTGCLGYLKKREDIIAYIRALYAWLVAEDLLKDTIVMADEVNLGNSSAGWGAAFRMVSENMPGMRYDFDVDPKTLLSEQFAGIRVDTWTPGIDSCAAQLSELAEARKKDVHVTQWSVCCWPMIPNSFLLSPLSEVRLHGAITELMGMDGFIRWDYCVWGEDPRRDMRLMRSCWPAGDGLFVYPSRGGEFLTSLRWWALRRGIEDFELMQMLKEKKPDMASQVIRNALSEAIFETDISKWNYADARHEGCFFALDNAPCERMRAIILNALEDE